MTVDIRCEIFCRFGAIVSGGISDDHVQSNWLIKTKGTLIIDRVFNPKRGQIVQLAYRRDGLVAPFPRLLTVLSSTADPYQGVTTLEVGCPLTLLTEKKERRLYKPGGDQYAPERAPQPIFANGLMAFCLSRLGIPLAAGSETLRHTYLWSEFDLSSGYVSAIQRLLESEACFGYITRNGSLRIEKLRLQQAEPGPLFGWQDLARIEHTPGAKAPPDGIEVAFRGRAAPASAGPDWRPVADDGVSVPWESWSPMLQGLPKLSSSGSNFGSSPQPDYPSDPVDDGDFQFWQVERADGGPQSVTIGYSLEGDPEGTSRSATFSWHGWSESRTQYAPFTLYDSATGRSQIREYAVNRTTFTNTSVPAANGALVKWCLENEQGFPSGTLWGMSVTTYQYSQWAADGPKVTIETTEEYVNGIQIAGSLGIKDYGMVGGFAGAVLASRTITKTEANISGSGSRTTTARWLAWGLTQEGSQACAAMAERAERLEPGEGASIIAAMMESANRLVFDGIETRTTSSGARPATGMGDGPAQLGRIYPQTRPTVQELWADNIDPYGDADRYTVAKIDLGSTADDVWQSPMDESSDAVSMRVSLPLSPDDYHVGVPGGETVLTRGRATIAAQEYGEAVLAAEVGASYGLSIMGDPWRLPTTPLAPVYIQHGDSTYCYKLTGMSWAISNNGMAVGSDSLLCGALGIAQGGG